MKIHFPGKKEMRMMGGKLKIWQGRLVTYVSMINFLMIFYLYILESPMGFLWYHWLVLVVSVCAVTVYLDVKYIFPAAQEYTFDKNPQFVKLREKTEENNVMLEKIIDHLGIE